MLTHKKFTNNCLNRLFHYIIGHFCLFLNVTRVVKLNLKYYQVLVVSYHATNGTELWVYEDDDDDVIFNNCGHQNELRLSY